MIVKKRITKKRSVKQSKGGGGKVKSFLKSLYPKQKIKKSKISGPTNESIAKSSQLLTGYKMANPNYDQNLKKQYKSSQLPNGTTRSLAKNYSTHNIQRAKTILNAKKAEQERLEKQTLESPQQLSQAPPVRIANILARKRIEHAPETIDTRTAKQIADERQRVLNQARRNQEARTHVTYVKPNASNFTGTEYARNAELKSELAKQSYENNEVLQVAAQLRKNRENRRKRDEFRVLPTVPETQRIGTVHTLYTPLERQSNSSISDYNSIFPKAQHQPQEVRYINVTAHEKLLDNSEPDFGTMRSIANLTNSSSGTFVNIGSKGKQFVLPNNLNKRSSEHWTGDN